ncbi:hypothetical protein [Amycolatopsis anabasis]|uniref:hypothetical protein n=1 Tax=Amycolatopsis anabasis TaxID=1840409 RepID=UPI00131C89ED|nr:hypothetical protein [Amycolatopsis anabasis]
MTTDDESTTAVFKTLWPLVTKLEFETANRENNRTGLSLLNEQRRTNQLLERLLATQPATEEPDVARFLLARWEEEVVQEPEGSPKLRELLTKLTLLERYEQCLQFAANGALAPDAVHLLHRALLKHAVDYADHPDFRDEYREQE